MKNLGLPVLDLCGVEIFDFFSFCNEIFGGR